MLLRRLMLMHTLNGWCAMLLATCWQCRWGIHLVGDVVDRGCGSGFFAWAGDVPECSVETNSCDAPQSAGAARVYVAGLPAAQAGLIFLIRGLTLSF
jgi:hypothetical protein